MAVILGERGQLGRGAREPYEVLEIFCLDLGGGFGCVYMPTFIVLYI